MQGEIQMPGHWDDRQTPGGWGFTKEGRTLQRALRAQDATAIVQARRLANATTITEMALDSAREVDSRRRILARGDEQLNAALIEIEVNHLAVLGRIQRGL